MVTEAEQPQPDDECGAALKDAAAAASISLTQTNIMTVFEFRLPHI